MNHKWQLQTRSGERFRRYVCERCGVGPILKDILSGKDSFNKLAKSQGFDPDCNIEVAKIVTES